MKRVLVANRGEIACRIIATCRRLGIETVAVYSDADRESRHTRLADRSVAIGPADPRLSYLDIHSILRAAKSSGADAIHPGYGFLSERPEFSAAVRAAGLVFIGPSAEAMKKLGDKIEAKKLAAASGVPLVPGVFLPSPDSRLSEAAAFAVESGFPVLVKAAAGGGGRGMRVVERAEDLTQALESASREAAAAFGDGTVFLEKFIFPARHVEVQLVGDSHGDILHFFDRDCSLQRNHQKVVEEAPAPNLPADARALMYDSAKSLLKLAGYVGAGTAEFIVDSEGRPYFLEVNSRLQVEHPVTEAITGVDLVELQLRVAEGGSLREILSANPVVDVPPSEELISALGSAIEVRLCAESYEGRFLPATGVVLEFSVPGAPEDVRVDTGIEPGNVVGHHYDSLLAKIIIAGGSREAALSRMLDVLSGTRLSGVRNNREILIRLLESDQFIDGEHHTATVAGLLPSEPERFATAREAALEWFRLVYVREEAAASPWDERSDFRLVRGAGRRHDFRIEGVDVWAEVGPGPNPSLTVGTPDGGSSRQMMSAPHPASSTNGTFLSTTRGTFEVLPLPLSSNRSFASSSAMASDIGVLRSPLPGRIVAIVKHEGDEVSEGEIVLVLESMKMEHPIRAPRAGRITNLSATSGSVVEARATLGKIG